jgi:F420-non-reducing hydrogenase iron-sulfur subunit
MGDCHYLYGNHMTVKRITFLQALLDFIGLGGRLHLAWISSAEAQKFVQVVADFTEHIRVLGPNPLKGLGLTTAGAQKCRSNGRTHEPAKEPVPAPAAQ